jgi:hypothetical protein
MNAQRIDNLESKCDKLEKIAIRKVKGITTMKNARNYSFFFMRLANQNSIGKVDVKNNKVYWINSDFKDQLSRLTNYYEAVTDEDWVILKYK